MKLSKKGRDRLYGSHNVFYDNDIEGDVVALYELSEVWEFEPDDFQGMVMLTVEEAKRVESLMNDLIDLYNKESIKILASGFETIYMVKHRIKQAEKSNE